MDKSENNSGKHLGSMLLGVLRNGIIDENPTLVQLIGMCPTLATTTSVKNAVGMGLAVTAVLICSNTFISLLRNFIPKQVRIACYVVVIAGFVSVVEMLMKAYFLSLYNALGVFIPLIVVNCIILARAEAFASKNTVLPSAVDGLAMGLGFTIALSILASIREIIGNGTILGVSVFGAAYKPATLIIMPAGAFLTLGCLVAFVNKIKSTISEHKAAAAASDVSDGDINPVRGKANPVSAVSADSGLTDKSAAGAGASDKTASEAGAAKEA